MANDIFFDRGAARRPALAALILTAAVGCGEAADDAGQDTARPGTLDSDAPAILAAEESGDGESAEGASWCEVKAIMDKSCTGCHDGEGTGGSPMGLTKPADFAASAPISTGKKVSQAVSARIHDAARPMPPRGLLPAADLAKIDAWIAAGAPAGSDATCTGSGPAKPAKVWPPAECDEVYELRSHGAGTAPFTVPPGGEHHPQIRIDAPWGNTKVQMIATKPLTDNAKVLHHWILYAGMSFLTGWAPGDDDEKPFPPDVGMDMPTGPGSLRLDMHYFNTGNSKSEQDRSGVAVCIVKGNKLRPKSAAVMMGFSVFGPVLAPANKKGHQATSSCRVSGTRPVTLMSASPHAHKYARHMKFSVRKANGQEIVMHDMPFKFGEQGSYPLDPPVVLNAGDTVVTTCIFDNDTNRSITFGESTENEMCFNFASYYPKGGLSCGGGFGGLGGLGGR